MILYLVIAANELQLILKEITQGILYLHPDLFESLYLVEQPISFLLEILLHLIYLETLLLVNLKKNGLRSFDVIAFSTLELVVL